jgi:isoquinoline 1-oxidoreductase alpha subunit
MRLTVNGTHLEVDAAPDKPLLWCIREDLGLTGTKFGCGVGQCGACMVHLDGAAVRSCVTPLSAAAGRSVTTIEAMSRTPIGRAVQAAWVAEEVPQCGYCQSGQVMSAVSLLEKIPHPTDADVDRGMSGNICRCGTYSRIRRAIHRAAALAQAK